MMKKLIALASAVTLVLLLPTLATAKETFNSAPHVRGTITSWDDGAKQATVTDSAGKTTPFGWNDKTMVTGTPKVGEHVSVSFMKDKDGRMWATRLSVGAKTASTKPPATK